MLQIPVYNKGGEETDRLEVDEALFGGRIHRELLRQAVVSYEANQRVGAASVKSRSQVSGSNRKPWPQKGTGRARAGTRKSPLWIGGGITFGPTPRDYSKKLNRKARRRAVNSALLGKMRDGEVIVVENLELDMPKTREMSRILKKLGVEKTFLVVLADHDEVLWRCTRNIPGAAMTTCRELNAYAVLRPKQVIFTREAFDGLLERAGAGAGDEEAEEATESVQATEEA